MPQNNIYASYMPSAVIQLQSLARARQAKQRMAKLRAERVRDATAYKSYLSSHTQDNTQGLLAWAGLDLLDNFLPVLRAAIAKHKGLKLHVSALWLGSNFGQVESFWATTPLRHICLHRRFSPLSKSSRTPSRMSSPSKSSLGQDGSSWKSARWSCTSLPINLSAVPQ